MKEISVSKRKVVLNDKILEVKYFAYLDCKTPSSEHSSATRQDRLGPDRVSCEENQ
jgi:hypothetical protein